MAYEISEDVDFNDGSRLIFKIKMLSQAMTVAPSLFPNGDYAVQKRGSAVDKQFAGELRGTFGDRWKPAKSLFGVVRETAQGQRRHNGLDIYAPSFLLPAATRVVASVAGKLTFKSDDDNNALGNRAMIWFTFEGKQYRFIYGHLSAFEGKERDVSPGELIGYSGCTGNANHDGLCTGKNKCGLDTGHVHLILANDSEEKFVDPLPALGWKLRYQQDARDVDCSQA